MIELVWRDACSGVQSDEQFSGECDADDHFGFAGGLQLGTEGGEVRIVAPGDVGDAKEDGAHAGAAAAHMPVALPFAAVIGDRRQTGQFGDCLVETGACVR